MDQEQGYYRRVVMLEARVNQLEAAMQALLTRLGIDPPEVAPPPPPELIAIHAALLTGDKIKAITLYRALHGVGLKEAKDAIDAM